MDGKQVQSEAMLSFRRLAQGDFQQLHVTEDEKKQLTEASPPVTSASAQDYAAWRKSLLWVAGVALCLLAILEFATFETQEEQAMDMLEAATSNMDGFQAAQARQNVENTLQAFGKANLETIDGIFTFLILPVLIGGILALIAAWKWTDVRLSRRLARIGFLIMFVTPFAMAVLPVKDMLDFGHLNAEQAKAVSQFIGLQMGLSFFLLIGPRAVALFPGIMRSSMALKTLLPESPMPGWAAALVSPLYSIFLLVIFSLVNQAYGNFILLAGIGCLMVAPLVYLKAGGRLLRPHTAEEVSAAVGRIRRTWMLFNGAGAILVGVWILDIDAFGVKEFFKFGLSFLGNVVFLTVVGGDLLLALLRSGHAQSRKLVESSMEGDLEARLEALGAAGFTDLKVLGEEKAPAQASDES